MQDLQQSKGTGQTPSKEARFSINEVFGPVIAGEGSIVGSPTHFVRFNGCSYRCRWCDSLHAVLPELIRLPGNNTLMTVDEICADLIKRPFAGMVTLSGGDPVMVSNMEPLIEALHNLTFKVNVETQGVYSQPWLDHCDYLTVSPKPPSSGMETDWDRLTAVLFQKAPHPHSGLSLKVVVFDDADLEFAAEVHYRYPRVAFFLQVGTPQTKPQLVEMAEDYRQLVDKVLADRRFARTRILPQLHAWVYGHGRGI